MVVVWIGLLNRRGGQVMLGVGNYCNGGGSRGGANGFKVRLNAGCLLLLDARCWMLLNTGCWMLLLLDATKYWMLDAGCY